MTTDNPRYFGKPLLRLLECYVLWAIDALPNEDSMTLSERTPKLQPVYGATGTWQQIIAAAVNLTSNIPEVIRATWVKNSEIARAHKTSLSPQEFAEMLVDQNFDNSRSSDHRGR
jgi:hypothetical protein